MASLADYLGGLMTKLFGSETSSYSKNPSTGTFDAAQHTVPGLLNKAPKLSIPKVSAAGPVQTPIPAMQPAPQSQSMAPLSLDSSVFSPGVSTESARPIIERILSSYLPRTPDVPPGYRSPMLDQTDLLASLSGQYGLDPRLLSLLGISETQGLRPAASGTAMNNPFNVMEPGTQNLHQYPSVEEAIKQYAAGIAGPSSDPSGQGLERYLNFGGLGPQSTLRDFIMTQNPSDNPDQQMNTILQIAQQLGL
jgi:hypothetical protein